jgi:hypothetical protein
MKNSTGKDRATGKSLVCEELTVPGREFQRLRMGAAWRRICKTVDIVPESGPAGLRAILISSWASVFFFFC